MSAQHHSFFDAGVLSEANLAAEHNIFLDDDAAGKTGLRGDHDILSDLAVVADVDQVVDLGAASDARDFKGAAVNGRVRANLDVIADFEAPLLGKFFVMSGRLVADVAEAVAAQHRSGVNDHAVAESRAGVDRDIGIQLAIAANTDARTNHCAGADPSLIADCSAFADHDPLRHGHIFSQPCRSMNLRAGVNAWRTVGRGAKKPCRPRKCQFGLA